MSTEQYDRRITDMIVLGYPDTTTAAMCFLPGVVLRQTSQRHLEEKLEVKSWLPWGWLWKVTYPLQLHRSWKPECLQLFPPPDGELVWVALPPCSPACAYSRPEKSTATIIDHSLNCICPDWSGGLEQRMNPSSCVLGSQGSHRSSTTSRAVTLERLGAHFYHDEWVVHFFHHLTAEWLSPRSVLHTYRPVHRNLTIQSYLCYNWINLVLAAVGLCVNTTWAQNRKLHVYNLISSPALLKLAP